MQDVTSNQVGTAQISNSTGQITGKLKNGTHYNSQGPSPSLPNDVTTMRNHKVAVSFPVQTTSLLGDLAPYLFIILIGAAFIYFIGRQTKGQMSGIMSIGRSKAKQFSSDRPSTTFDDVAGYAGVKQEISEVVDFLKAPARFKEIGAKNPQGRPPLVGDPGTGETLLARAVAGEAGVPFMSVSGSDFMEMFLSGWGVSRVARPVPDGAQAGAGHRLRRRDRLHRPQAWRRARRRARRARADPQPDALGDGRVRYLRRCRDDRGHQPPRHPRPRPAAPGPFRPPDRGPVTRPRGAAAHPAGPLQGQADARQRRSLRGGPRHAGHERRRPGQPGQRSGAARRAPRQPRHRQEDPSPPGTRASRSAAQSMVLSEAEKERVAYHDGGHALLAYVLEHADPVHKVTILPTGMALGVTHQLPMEERHIHPRQYIEDSLCVRMGGRVAEILVYGDLSTGAANDLVGNTELARKMVREWGMSEAIGPMAWGSQGQVFLGEDLMHTRDYSEDTSKIIDDEVERILRAEEERAMEVLSKHRGGLNAIARALLDNEIIDGREVSRLVDEAHGAPVHTEGAKSVPQFNGAPTNGNGTASRDADPQPAVVPPRRSARPGPTAPWAPPPWPPPESPSAAPTPEDAAPSGLSPAPAADESRRPASIRGDGGARSRTWLEGRGTCPPIAPPA